MLVNLNAVITIHCRTFFFYFFFLLLFHLKVPRSQSVCAPDAKAFRSNQNMPRAELMNARGEGVLGTWGGGGSSVCDLLYHYHLVTY